MGILMPDGESAPSVDTPLIKTLFFVRAWSDGVIEIKQNVPESGELPPDIPKFFFTLHGKLSVRHPQTHQPIGEVTANSAFVIEAETIGDAFEAYPARREEGEREINAEMRTKSQEIVNQMRQAMLATPGLVNPGHSHRRNIRRNGTH